MVDEGGVDASLPLELGVLPACLSQRRRSAFVEPLLLVTHPEQGVCLSDAVTLSLQLAVRRILIDRCSAEIRQPRLDVPPRIR